jgi:hypothetical protein
VVIGSSAVELFSTDGSDAAECDEACGAAVSERDYAERRRSALTRTTNQCSLVMRKGRKQDKYGRSAFAFGT